MANSGCLGRRAMAVGTVLCRFAMAPQAIPVAITGWHMADSQLFPRWEARHGHRSRSAAPRRSWPPGPHRPAGLMTYTAACLAAAMA